jgi:hypothetical protein
MFSGGMHGAGESKGGDGEEEEGCDAATALTHAVVPVGGQARRRRGFTARGEVGENRAAARSVEGSSPLGLTCHCIDKAGYIYSAPLYICRVVILLLRQRRGASLGELQRALAPALTQRALYGAKSSRGWSGKTT